MTELPWSESTEWKYGNWYPLPNLSTWSDRMDVVDGYGIYKLDVNAPVKSGDLEPVISQRFTLRDAILLCEAHNGELFGDTIAPECRR